jgi:sugar lactone lactonase YvrE
MLLDVSRIRCLTDQADQLGESPFWHPWERCLYWVDIPGRAVQRLDQHASQQRWTFAEEPGCIAPTADGALLVALRSAVVHFAPDTGAQRVLAEAPYDTATTRFNDGRCDPRGRFWVGTVFEPKTEQAAALYCMKRSAGGGWSLEQHLGDNLTANGLAFSPASSVAWWSKTADHVIYRYDFDLRTGRFGAATEFHRFAAKGAETPYGGRPDGAAVDSAGNYWVAMYEGGRVLQFAPDGHLLLEIALPVTCPTMVCLGGDDLRTLFVTTASRGRPAAELAREPMAGHLLAIQLDDLPVPADLRGMPVDHFDPAA